MNTCCVLLYLLGTWQMYEDCLPLAYNQNNPYPQTVATLAAFSWPLIVAWTIAQEVFEALLRWKNKP